MNTILATMIKETSFSKNGEAKNFAKEEVLLGSIPMYVDNIPT
jgi:hypothetical protein